MSMFNNYENLNENNVPYNITLELPTQRAEYTSEPPYMEYDMLGRFIGYSWNYGDTFTLSFHIEPVIKVEQDALVYTEPGEEPTSSIIGKLYQKAYNTADLKVWVCKTYDQTVYVWEEQNKFTYPKNGTKEITLVFETNLIQKKAHISIMSFRREVIYSVEANLDSVIYLPIDAELSAKLLKGIYYCEAVISDSNSSKFSSEYTLIVK